MNDIGKARIQDVPQIHKLVNHFADKGEMLARPLSEIYENIRDFIVAMQGEEVVACAALHVCWSDLAEIRSVAVAEVNQKQGLGKQLVVVCMEEARALGINDVFCFTYRPDFFKRHGFVVIDKMDLPRKVWIDCFRCPKFPNCDEVALINKMEVSA